MFGSVIMLKQGMSLVVLFVLLSCTNAKSQVSVNDLKLRGYKGPVKKMTTTYYSAKQLKNNKPIRKEDFLTKDVVSYNENGGMAVNELITSAAYTRGKTYYTKLIALSLNEFPLTIESFSVSAFEGGKYSEKDKIKETTKRKVVNSNLYVTDYFTQGKLKDRRDSAWLDDMGQAKTEKFIYSVGEPEDSLMVIQTVERLTNKKQEMIRQTTISVDLRNPKVYKTEGTELTEVTKLRIDQYGNPTCVILRDTATGVLKTAFREIEYYTDKQSH
ncbi:hypothetical protein [Pedobacter nototheniae]|uniref:hypothetical protein n=1 Tax=Pedobacter nototheniae TaxID=2488994 RepID=UPI00292D6A8F|nr:hypothetical protein [Pedobacter nototheniae]